jgi:hypothetical protein
MEERKCQNWLSEFAKWTLPRSEAPESFIFWTGIFTLASAIKRNVTIPKRMMGSWEVIPNVYILFVADPGKARKTTTANYAEDLFEIAKGITRSPELISKEALLQTLVESPDQTIAILAPEFGEFMAKSGVDMYGWLTNMYDGKRRIVAKTISRSTELAEKPCVNLLGATTPVWIAENMPESVIGGGFASRVIFIHEDTVRRRKLFYNKLDWSVLDDIQKSLSIDLARISKIKGAMEFESQETMDKIEAWYTDTADEGTAAHYKLSGYYERRPAYALKLAIILHLAYSDELVLTLQDFNEAVAILKQIEKKLPKVFEAVGKNPYVVDMNRIYDFILERKKVVKSDLYREFSHAAEQPKLDELLNALYVMKYIQLETVGPELYISPATNGVQVDSQ